METAKQCIDALTNKHGLSMNDIAGKLGVSCDYIKEWRDNEIKASAVCMYALRGLVSELNCADCWLCKEV